MPTTLTAEGICNMALGHLKITRQISILASDKSSEAEAFRLFYDNCKQQMLEDFKWPFATTQGSLALIENNPFPINSSGDSEWAFAYQYPADALNFVRILSGIRNEARADRVPFRIMSNNVTSGLKMILTDMSCAVGEWTSNIVSEDSFTSSYAMALSLKLAGVVAPMVTGGDQFKLGMRALQLYGIQLEQAKANSLNEEQMEQEPESEFVLARDYRPTSWNQRFR